jgi:hypothetical protein
MSKKAIRQAPQMTVDKIAIVATTRLARVLATRQAAGLELSSEELSQVSGGQARPVIIDGMTTSPRLGSRSHDRLADARDAEEERDPQVLQRMALAGVRVDRMLQW